jgi:GNAT superfamily N-acetyltransferase
LTTMKGERVDSPNATSLDVSPRPDLGCQVAALPLGKNDIELLKIHRLRALTEDPSAFVTPLKDEKKRTAAEWCACLADLTWVVARDGHDIVGLAGCRIAPEDPTTTRYIESVWVHPGRRREGVLRAMLEELERCAHTDGVRRMQLWVLETNDDARLAYKCLGFESDGVKHEVEAEDKREVEARCGTVYELRMYKDLI